MVALPSQAYERKLGNTQDPQQNTHMEPIGYDDGALLLQPANRQPKVELLPRHSTMGNVRPLTIVDGPADWRAADLRGKEDTFTYTFSPSDTAELLRAVRKLKQAGVQTEEDILKVRACSTFDCCSWIHTMSDTLTFGIMQLKDSDYDLPTLRSTARSWGLAATMGRGFQLVRQALLSSCARAHACSPSLGSGLEQAQL